MAKYPDLDPSEMKELGSSFGIKTNNQKELKESIGYIWNWVYAGVVHPDLCKEYKSSIKDVF